MDNTSEQTSSRLAASLCAGSLLVAISSTGKRKTVILIVLFATFHMIILTLGLVAMNTNLVRRFYCQDQILIQGVWTSDISPIMSSQERKKTAMRSNGKNGTKTILLWNMPNAVSYPEHLNPDRCGRCKIIKDRTRVAGSDAVVLHYHNVTRMQDLPPSSTRNHDQVYVWSCRESPNTTKEIYHLDLSKLNNVINWTMTHRSDSDVFYPYAEILHRIHDERKQSPGGFGSGGYVEMYYDDVDRLIEEKEHLVAWVVGNCGSTKGAKARMNLANLLIKEGLDIHRFGRCFNERSFPPYRAEETHKILSKYKFYLAFENTFHCRDYVTYKFWKNALYSGAVPIVWGVARDDLERLAPRHSFIHVEDFESLPELVKYIHKLDSNETAYREYFKWRVDELERGHEDSNSNRDSIFSLSEAFGYCKLCQMLHARKGREGIKRKVVSSLDNWWYGSEHEDCISSRAGKR